MSQCALIAETIVIAGGGTVAADNRRGIEEKCPEVVDTAAHALAIRPCAIAVAAAGGVVADVRSTHEDGSGRDINAAAQAVAAIATVAAHRLIVPERGIRDRCVTSENRE